jgi:hypothetical protein
MTEYHKINALFMRDMGLPNKPLIKGAWASPEFGYLANNQWEYTEKVDGTNIRVVWSYEPGDRYKTVKFFGRTDRASIPEELHEMLKDTFTTDLFESAFPSADSNPIVLYGEGYGPKIQNGGLYRSNQSFVLFDVKVGTWWLKREDVNDVADNMRIDSVPVIGYGTLWEAIDIVSGGPTERQTNLYGIRRGYWNGRDGLKSSWGDFEAEGIVARPEVALFNRQGSRIIAKIKARDFR